MCGINGIAFSARSGRQVDERVLCAMRDVITHRGPDDRGVYIKANIGLGHRRLSIVDVAHGHQPMFNSDKTTTLVFNGEIYNHGDHRDELEAKGYKYETTSDTETILYLYEEYGFECVEKLRGMFAFAVWDERKNQLFIARDRVGIKPLYYVHDDQGNLFFASEIKSLTEAKAVKPNLNYDALPDQLANHGTSYDETLYEGVKRLMPGHFLVWKDGEISIKKYWNLEYEPKHFGLSDQDYVEQWLAEFKESVRLRLMADVPLGMFLSGGIDSSAIAAVMSELVSEPIKTFSVGFKEREANEFKYARMVSEKFGTDHHEITITPEQFFSKLPDLIWHEDEPLGFVASVPLYFVSELAQKHVKVVLTGEGSDEMMAGYARYYKGLKLLEYGKKYESLTPSFVRSVVRSGLRTLPNRLNKKLNRTFLSLDSDVESLYFDNFAIFNKANQDQLLSDETKSRISDRDPYQHIIHWFEKENAEELLDKLLYVDTKTYLHELLMKQDQMSMAASIESRVPFLDHELVEFTAKMPTSLKLRGTDTKWILREAMKGILPKEILSREKMGFPVPIGSWFRNEFQYLIREFVLGERALARGIFNADFVRQLAERHFSGENHDLRLLFLLNFEIWQRQILEGEEVKISLDEK
ncbi:MAG: asparagine synthase (glutamine-hydrolyzing) [Pyrinomonadaceae bacterium]|nr:asparagine synthase (glutamine-hydrolyzing) [Pyrinomonadaceae bacterium]